MSAHHVVAGALVQGRRVLLGRRAPLLPDVWDHADLVARLAGATGR